ncbi:Ger(x)C family spore germination protein [Paenibacillus methanolicus]|uniref:Spore germination protein KC n=1 Tax=Paenibacillus methanolicus TaxID=582686 RepID=A0A5S5C8S7_9BACL|nr:Ger(x)C family spore germination protein [Paenibacillus methanolicus]TYP74730.1 spore germination protein KC [Paenibacillus methanolicus]
MSARSGRLLSAMALLACMIALSGCWSRKELNDISIAAAMGIDWKDNQYLLTVQVVNPGNVSQKQGDTSAPVVVYSAKGVTLNEGVRRLTSSISRKIFFSHIRIVVLSEELAKRGIARPLDFLMRGNEIRSDFTVVIAKGNSAKDVLGVLTPIEKIPANFIFNALEVANKEWSPVAAIKLDELSKFILAEGVSPVLSGIHIYGEPSKGKLEENVKSSSPSVRLQHAGIAAFKKDKLVGWLNEKESRGYNAITDRIKRTSLHVSCPDGGVVGINIAAIRTKMRGEVKEGRMSIQLQTKIRADISSVECEIDLTDPAVLQTLNGKVEAVGKDVMRQAVAKAKRLGTDIFGFGIAIHRADPGHWKKVKDNWDERFKELDIAMDVHVSITGTGTIGESPVNKAGDGPS